MISKQTRLERVQGTMREFLHVVQDLAKNSEVDRERRKLGLSAIDPGEGERPLPAPPGFRADPRFDVRKLVHRINLSTFGAAVARRYGAGLDLAHVLDAHLRLNVLWRGRYDSVFACCAQQDFDLTDFAHSSLVRNGHELLQFTFANPEREVIRAGDVLAWIPAIADGTLGSPRQELCAVISQLNHNLQLPHGYFGIGTATAVMALAFCYHQEVGMRSPSRWVTTDTRLTSFGWKERHMIFRFEDSPKNAWVGWSFRTTKDARYEGAGCMAVVHIPWK